MSRSDALVCPSCGALNAADADQCELCGTPLHTSSEEDVPAEGPPAAESTPGAVAAGGVFCNQCGWKNPPGARFCSRCGTPLQEVAAAPPVASRPGSLPPAPAPMAGAAKAGEAGSVKRQVTLLVGISVVLIVALFVVTLVSKDLTEPAPASIPAAEEQAADAVHDAVPMPAAVAEQVETLEQEIEAATGAARVEKQQELVNLLIGVGRYAQAAEVQTEVAEAVGSAEAWRRAGDLYSSWMDSLQDTQKRPAADQAVQAYQRALDLDPDNPDNLDIRTAMATAYLSSSSPMRGVQEIKRVLEENPGHVQARFNYGIMLTMINRPEQAIEQFEAVQRIVGEDSPYYRQAAQAIAGIRQNIGS